MAARLSALMRRPPFTPQKDFWYSFLLEAEELGQLKNPIISSGMEPATFQFVA
jgi:hypothetical protein